MGSFPSGTPESFVDLRLVGSHPKYKLTFTNTNTVAIKSPYWADVDQDWAAVQALKLYNLPLNQEPTTDQLLNFYSKNPAINKTIYNETDNSDDCRTHKKILKPNESCSIYMIGTWFPNFNDYSDMSYPIRYIVDPVNADEKIKGILVNQCRWEYPRGYKCNSDSDKSLFINFKMTVADTIANSFGYISDSGNFTYSGEDDPSHEFMINIKKIPITYKNNVFSYGTPELVLRTNSKWTMPDLALDYSGDNIWVQAYPNHYLIVTKPDSTDDYGKDYDVPNGWRVGSVSVAARRLIMNGRDGSTWVNVTDIENLISYGSVVYNKVTDSFESTGVFQVYDVDSNGVVIGKKDSFYKDSFLGCWIKNNNNKYEFHSLEGYSGDYYKHNDFIQGFRSYSSIYLPMYIPNTGEDSYGLFKVHTKDSTGKPACYIDADDFIIMPSNINTSGFTISNTEKFTAISDKNNKWFIFDPAKVYLGK